MTHVTRRNKAGPLEIAENKWLTGVIIPGVIYNPTYDWFLGPLQRHVFDFFFGRSEESEKTDFPQGNFPKDWRW